MHTPDRKIWVTVVKNPFDPHRTKDQQWFDHISGMTAHDAVKSYYPMIGDDLDYEVSVNGKLLSSDEILSYLVKPNDNVVFCTVPHGGDGNGAKMLRTIAMIAVMVVATAVTSGVGAASLAYMFPGTVFGAGTAGSMIAGAAVALAGGIIVNGVLPPQTPDTQALGSDLGNTSPTYAWGASPNAYLEGSRWPVLYGTRRIAPPIIAKHITTKNSDTDDETKQFLHILMAVADHAVDSITDIEINGSPIANFEGASYETKLGALDQTVISDFYWQRQQTSVSQEIDIDTAYIGNTTGDAVTALEVGLLLPAGLYHVEDDGSLRSIYYKWNLYYRATGDVDWITWKTVSLFKNTRRTLRAYAIKTGLTADQYDIKVEVNMAPPDSDRYSPMESYVEYIGEIINEDFTYPGASLLAIKALATGQLSGSQPTITCTATRSQVTTGGGVKAANSPAWAAYDMHCNPEYGESIPYSEMVIADFTTWASFCSTNSIECNLYIDSKMSLIEAVANVEQLGRGKVVERGTSYSCLVDTVASSVQLFGIGNIVEDTFSMNYLDYADQANIVQVSFFDEDNDYIKRIAQVTKTGFDPSTDEANIVQLSLYACTNSDTALKHATYLLNGNTLQIRTVEFEAGFDSIACQAGDVISVAFDAIDWGQSGRVVTSTALSTTVDRSITLAAGTTYYAVVQHQNDDDIETVELTAVGVETTSDTFAIEAPGWVATPAVDAVISIGTTSKITKPFRVTSITRASDQIRKIQALQYDADVYDDTVVAEDFIEPDTPEIVAGLSAREVSEILDGRYRITVNLSWRGAAYQWRVYYRKNGDSDWIYLGISTRSEYAVENLVAGESYDFAVTDMWHGPDYYDTVEGLSIIGWSDTTLPIYKVSGLEIAESGNGSVWYGRDLKLAWNTTAEFWPDGADGDPGGASTYTPAELALVYRIRVYDSDSNLLREVIIKESEWTYTYEMNYQDNSGSPKATLSISVWARNMNGMESSVPATLYVTNPAPSAVTGLDSLAYMGGVKAYWNANTDPDIAGYQVRYTIDESGQTITWTGIDWIDVDGTEFVAPLTNLQRISDTNTAYFQVRAKDTFGNYSSIVEDEATADDFFVVQSELSSALQTSISNSAEMTSQVTLMDDSWTVKIQEDGYITGMGLLLYDQWVSTTTYSADDYVYNDGVIYICILESLNHEPPNATYWTAVPNGARSEAIFLVDKFLIVDPDEDDVQRAPFIVGNINGTPTVGVNGALVVDGTITALSIAANTITASEIAANTITASQIKGTDFGTLTISSGKIVLSASNGLEVNDTGAVKFNDGADLLFVGGAASNPVVKFSSTEDSEVNYLYFQAQSDTDVYTLSVVGSNPQLYIGTNSLDFGDIFLFADTTQTREILPYTSATFDLGSSTKRWHEIFASHVLNVADLYWMDERVEDGVIIPVDDINIIENIKPTGDYDPITGLRLINDSTLPSWLVHKHQQAGEVHNEAGDIIQTWEPGDIAYSPEGKPFLSNAIMTSLLMGAARQFNLKFKIIQKVMIENNLITTEQLAAARAALEALND